MRFFIFVCKIKQKPTNSEENICTHLGHIPNACIRNGSFVNFESVLIIPRVPEYMKIVCFLLILTVIGRCHTILALKLFAQVGWGKAHFRSDSGNGFRGFIA